MSVRSRRSFIIVRSYVRSLSSVRASVNPTMLTYGAVAVVWAWGISRGGRGAGDYPTPARAWASSRPGVCGCVRFRHCACVCAHDHECGCVCQCAGLRACGRDSERSRARSRVRQRWRLHAQPSARLKLRVLPVAGRVSNSAFDFESDDACGNVCACTRKSALFRRALPVAGRVRYSASDFENDNPCVRTLVRQRVRGRVLRAAALAWPRERSRARQRVLQVAGNVCVCAHVRVRDS